MPNRWLQYRHFFWLLLVMSTCCFVFSNPTIVIALDAIKVSIIEGSARVIDGDTIEVRSVHVRLLGMDAPEKAQACRNENGQHYLCGIIATEKLEQIISGDLVVCTASAKDRYGRQLAICSTNKIADIGLEMVRRGWATVYDGALPTSEYKEAENQAKRRKLGLWLGSFERPSVWRRNKRA